VSVTSIEDAGDLGALAPGFGDSLQVGRILKLLPDVEIREALDGVFAVQQGAKEPAVLASQRIERLDRSGSLITISNRRTEHRFQNTVQQRIDPFRIPVQQPWPVQRAEAIRKLLCPAQIVHGQKGVFLFAKPDSILLELPRQPLMPVT
jgi:hypothetical protein